MVLRAAEHHEAHPELPPMASGGPCSPPELPKLPGEVARAEMSAADLQLAKKSL